MSRLLLIAALLLAGCAGGEAGEAGAPAPETAAARPDAPAARTAPDDDGRSLAERIDDASLATQVQKALLDTAALRPFDFQVDARHGRVALRGSVATADQRRLAGEIAGQVRGVEAVQNELALPDTTTADSSAAPAATDES